MEVHHHPEAERKRFKEYFFEFLMIFLAVLLGFFSENIREHQVENSRARELAYSLIKDFQSDTSKLNWILNMRNDALTDNNLLLLELRKKPTELDTGRIQVLAESVSRPWYYLQNSGTYEQVKNSGSLRYFSFAISKSLTTYEQNNKQIEFAQSLEKDYFNGTISPFLFKELNTRYIEAKKRKDIYNGTHDFKRKDPFIVEDLYSIASYTKSQSTVIIYLLGLQRDDAVKNMALLRKEYDIHE